MLPVVSTWSARDRKQNDNPYKSTVKGQWLFISSHFSLNGILLYLKSLKLISFSWVWNSN